MNCKIRSLYLLPTRTKVYSISLSVLFQRCFQWLGSISRWCLPVVGVQMTIVLQYCYTGMPRHRHETYIPPGHVIQKRGRTVVVLPVIFMLMPSRDQPSCLNLLDVNGHSTDGLMAPDLPSR